jgi:hypothetical protein
VQHCCKFLRVGRWQRSVFLGLHVECHVTPRRLVNKPQNWYIFTTWIQHPHVLLYKTLFACSGTIKVWAVPFSVSVSVAVSVSVSATRSHQDIQLHIPNHAAGRLVNAIFVSEISFTSRIRRSLRPLLTVSKPGVLSLIPAMCCLPRFHVDRWDQRAISSPKMGTAEAVRHYLELMEGRLELNTK